MADIQHDPAKPAKYRLDPIKAGQQAADVRLGERNVENGLKLDLPWEGSGDGWTEVVERQGKDGRMNGSGPNGRKGRTIFFDVDDRFIFKGNHPRVTIEVEYFDEAPGELALHYDGKGEGDDHHKKVAVKCNGTTDWQHATFNLDDAYFGNRCGEHGDFGLRRPGDGGQIIIRQVWVKKAAPTGSS
jgi:hypothetical protein